MIITLIFNFLGLEKSSIRAQSTVPDDALCTYNHRMAIKCLNFVAAIRECLPFFYEGSV